MRYSSKPIRHVVVIAAAATCVACNSDHDFYNDDQVRPIQQGQYRSMQDCAKDWNETLCERRPATGGATVHPIVGPYFFQSGSTSHAITPSGHVQPFTHQVTNAANTTTTSRTVASVYNTPGRYSAGQSNFAANRAAAVSRGGMASARGGSGSSGG